MAKKITFISKIKNALSTTRGKLLTLLLLFFAAFFLYYCSPNPKNNLFHNKTFYIAHDPSFYPLNLMGKDKNFVAFASDLLFEISKRQKIKIQLIPIPANALFEKLERRDYDALITVISPSVSYRQKYLISSSFYDLGPVLIGKNLKGPISIEEIQKKVIGVQRNSLDALYFEPLGIIMHPYDSMMFAFDDLDKGRIDAIIVPYLLANTYTQLFYPGKYNIVTTPLTDEGLRAIALKLEQNQFLIEEINKGLKELKADGTYDGLLKKWGLANPVLLEEIKESLLP